MPDEPVVKRPRGNPNLVKGHPPYNTHKGPFQRWLEDNPSYERKSRRPSAEIVRRFLEEVVNPRHEPIQRDGFGKERLEKLLTAVYKTAINPKSKNQITAAQLMLMYAYGKPRANDADLDAIRKGGLTVVYVNRPAVDPDIPVAPQPVLESGPPQFIDAEVVEE